MGRLEQHQTEDTKNKFLIKHFLEKEKRPYQSIGRGLNNDVCYIGTYIEDDNGKFRNAVVTSDRKMYVDMDTGNQIKNDFKLNYRDELFLDILSKMDRFF